MTIDERAETVRVTLGKHYSHPDMHHTTFVVPDAEWDANAPADPTNLHRPFGWVPPFEREVGKGEFWYSPERIARQTMSLTPEELKAYLDIIMFVGDTHICHYHIDDQRRRVELAEEELLTTAPGSFDLMNRVQLAVLDNQQET